MAKKTFTFKDIWNVIRQKNNFKRDTPQIFKDKTKMEWNVLDDKRVDEHAKRWHVVHFSFKYRLWVPFLMLCQKVLDKQLVKAIPKREYNKNLQIFDDAFEQSIEDWAVYWMRQGGPDEQRKPVSYWKKFAKKSNSAKYLRIMKRMVETMILTDTAYREYFNILMHNIHHKMHEEYANKEKYPNGTGHVFYADGNIYDVHYYVLFKQMQLRGVMQVRDAQAEFAYNLQAAQQQPPIAEIKPKEEKP